MEFANVSLDIIESITSAQHAKMDGFLANLIKIVLKIALLTKFIIILKKHATA